MNQKEFTQQLSDRLTIDRAATASRTAALISLLTRSLQENQAVNIPHFGTFEVRKKMERIAVNPATGQRMLVPPKLSLVFKPAPRLKERYK